jgi:ribosomal subunit interface protein
MTIEIRSLNVHLPDAIRIHAQRCLRSTLVRFGLRVRHVTVYLSIADGPQHIDDKNCKITAAILGAGHLCASARAVDLYTAIDRAIDALARVISRDVGWECPPAVHRLIAAREPPIAVFHEVPRGSEEDQELANRDLLIWF